MSSSSYWQNSWNVHGTMNGTINQDGFLQQQRHINFYQSVKLILKQLKLRPIIDQSGTYIYKVLKVIVGYLSFLAKNECNINGTLSFSEVLKNRPFPENCKDVSYDVASLYTSVPVQDTIYCILYRIYGKRN